LKTDFLIIHLTCASTLPCNVIRETDKHRVISGICRQKLIA